MSDQKLYLQFIARLIDGRSLDLWGFIYDRAQIPLYVHHHETNGKPEMTQTLNRAGNDNVTDSHFVQNPGLKMSRLFCSFGFLPYYEHYELIKSFPPASYRLFSVFISSHYPLEKQSTAAYFC